MSKETKYELVMPFVSNSKKWAEGFECGMLYLNMEQEQSEIKNYFHKSNLEQIKIMAQKFEYEIKIETPQEDWVEITLTKDTWKEYLNEDS